MPVPEPRATVPGQRGAEPGSGPAWRMPGMPWLLGAAALWFSGVALLVPGLAERAGFGLVCVPAALPALAVPLAWPIARVAGDSDRVPASEAGRDPAALRHALAGPIAALVVITASGGAILTFAPHIL